MEASNLSAKRSNSSGSLVSSRGDARISIAEKWANRRKLQEEKTELQRKPLDAKAPCPALPLCVLVRRSWDQATKGFLQHHNNNGGDGDKIKPLQKESSKPSRPPKFKKHENNKRTPFPSVLSVLTANAVRLQVEALMTDDEENRNGNNDGGLVDGKSNSSSKNSSGLRVLPANCSDFTTSAVNHMSDSRSRAFLLLDFSAIVQTYTVWRKRLSILKNRKNVQIVYSARHNCNGRLLQLLKRLGIGFRVSAKYDLAAVREATRDNDDDNNAVIWDDASILVKPTSFYRNLLLDHDFRDDENDGDSATAATRTTPVTVATAEEMQRIHEQLHKICKRRRRRQRQKDLPKLEFVLKLDNAANDFGEWKTVLRNAHEKSSELLHAKVVGVALELGGIEETKTKTVGTAGADSSSTGNKKHSFLLDALSVVVENWVDEFAVSKLASTSNETTAMTQSHPRRPQVHLTNPITATEIGSDVIEWIENHRKLCNGITIDASRLLMANAAALCARIIGVKNNNNNIDSNSHSNSNQSDISNRSCKNNSDEDFNDVSDELGTNLDASNDIQEQQQKEANTIQQHLYIDDGCYGSLSNYPNEGIPLPLKSQRLVRSLSATSRQILEREQKNFVNTTVWGPTCEYIE